MIKIGGKEREFDLGFYAFRVADKRHGVRITGEEFGNLSMGDFAKYLWIGLLVSDPTLTEDQVLKWMQDASPEFTKACYDAVMDGIGSFGKLVLGEDEEDAPGKPEAIPPDGPSTGDASSLRRTGS